MATPAEEDVCAAAVGTLTKGLPTEAVKKAAKKLKDNLQANLLPGETLTFSHGGKSAVVGATAVDIDI